MTCELIGGPSDGFVFEYYGDLPDDVRIPTMTPMTQIGCSSVAFGFPKEEVYVAPLVINGHAKYYWVGLNL